ncbi:TetR/AcrR family transcriptional regulator [Photobacterium sp. 1_MG-2023]|uniref:TetR/AcrR family transcriptional regulator n=1 Tax=Photobacterium sp. 1_MG-2023 TaxID=3062646 RepID=UPI0026E242B2|nr:TetR/AcrR family transcriptional regulator [Photobacterium sp. 1_MG-2023]MDO6708522.1 TetR/AcrR family transcriptional regulator [Photobacterium sp. 1_MG-2023]
MTVNKKQQLLDAALTLFTQHGIQATATAKIAKTAGVANGTLFHHFASKQALVEALYLSIKADMSQVLLPPDPGLSTQAQFAHLWQAAIDWGLTHPQQFQFLRQMANDPHYLLSHQHDMLSQALPILPALIRQAQQDGLIAEWPLPLILNACHSQFLATVSLMTEQPALAADPTCRQASFEMLWHGMARHTP